MSEECLDERMLVVIPKGAVAKDPRPAPGSVLPKSSTDLKVKKSEKMSKNKFIFH